MFLVKQLEMGYGLPELQYAQQEAMDDWKGTVIIHLTECKYNEITFKGTKRLQQASILHVRNKLLYS